MKNTIASYIDYAQQPVEAIFGFYSSFVQDNFGLVAIGLAILVVAVATIAALVGPKDVGIMVDGADK